jgi:AraC-like DNA-binding protein
MTVARDMVRVVVDLAARAGMDVDDLRPLGDGDLRLPRDEYYRFWDGLVARSDETIGLRLAQEIDPGIFGVLDYTIRNAPTVRAALYHLRRHHRTLYSGAPLELRIDEGQAIFGFASPLLPRATADFILGALHTVVSQLAGPDFRATWARFQYPPPEDREPLRRAFGCRVDFGQPDTAFHFDAKVLDRKVEGADPRLHELLQGYLPPPPAEVQNEGFRTGVESAIDRALVDGVSLDRIAADLKLSPSTLKRRLRNELGESFTSLVRARREAIAKRLLDDDSVTVSEVAHLLGYADPSNFVRAFKGWTGASPSRYRETR